MYLNVSVHGTNIYRESQFKCIDSFLQSNIPFKTSSLIIKTAFLAVVHLSQIFAKLVAPIFSMVKSFLL